MEQLTVLEWSGLAAIERACGDTAGLGVVRPLLLMRDDAGIVMSFTDAPTLRNVVLDLSRLRRGRGSLDDAIAGCTLAGQLAPNLPGALRRVRPPGQTGHA